MKLLKQSFIVLLHTISCIGFDFSNLGNSLYIGTASVLYVGIDYGKAPCYKFECCTVGKGSVYWINNDANLLETLLKEKLFGQHIATKILSKQLGAFLTDPKPAKPFVVHISGKTGTGKNHIANIIAQARYFKGTESRHVLKIIGTHKYSSLELEKARKKIMEEVSEHVKRCKHALVVIDESDKLPTGTLNAISPFLDINPHVDGIDYRNTIFIFLSNTAGNAIKDYTNKQLSEGFSREQITVRDMETIIQAHLYNEGELRHSSLISRYQLDAFIPMLPLEKRHLILCAEEQLRLRKNKCGCSDEKCISIRASEIVDEIDFTERFSRSGCKKIWTKANLICPVDYHPEL